VLEKILVANRGEIALRVIRACKEMGIESVAIYSEADVTSLHVRYADEAYMIGPAAAEKSYMDSDKLIEVAKESGADAIHPGYGFLAENVGFAEKCEKNNLVFVGPSSSTLRLTGDKLKCRLTMKRVGVPILPGGEEIVESEDEAVDVAEKVGWPVLVKSAFGGGGRGIRMASNERELRETMRPAQLEAQAAYGKTGVYIEKCIVSPRHIELQLLCDQHGNMIHLGERECSIQRRFQKLLEMSPSPIMDGERRAAVADMAKAAARSVEYTSAGTIEFITDGTGNFYFIEVNSRLQVEHPVTEMVTGVDLVKQQIRIASGEEITIRQDDVEIRGAAIECRINAEDPFNDFVPSIGTVDEYHPPGGPGIRVDTALYRGYTVPVHYDSLVGKLVAWGSDFNEAVSRMRNALDEFVIGGIKTTIPLQKGILEDEHFVQGKISTDFVRNRRVIEKIIQKQAYEMKANEELAVLVAASVWGTPKPTRLLSATQGGQRTLGISRWKAAV